MNWLTRRSLEGLLVVALLPTAAFAQQAAVTEERAWKRIGALPADAELTVTLASGERRRYRFAGTIPEGLRLMSLSGQQEILKKSDVVRIDRHRVNDTTADGAVLGALIGVGTGAGLMTAAYAACDGSCDAPARGPMFLSAMGFCGGIGAITGWIIDKAHKGKETVFATVKPIATRDRKGVALSLRF